MKRTLMHVVAIRLRRGLILGMGISGLALAEMDMNPEQFGASIDFGQAMKSAENSSIKAHQPLSRTGVFLTTSGTYDKRFEVQLTIGGLFWYALPERDRTQTRILFGPGVGQAQGYYKFGNPENPFASLQMGLFGHKYNPDAKNLGEYLFRSGTYPGYLWTGGWSYVNSAAYLAQGLRLVVPTLGGKLTHEFTLYMERDIVPAHDLSPGYLLTFKPAGFFEFGAGLVWQNGLSFKADSVLSPRERRNAYVKSTSMPLTKDDQLKPGYSLNDTILVDSSDVRWGVYDPVRRTSYISSSPEENGTSRDLLAYYTFQGIKSMARASLDFGVLMGMPANTFKAYAELALLGLKNYPFYYEKKSERMPFMFGLNVPTFGLLDMLSMEFEYLKSPFRNTINYSYYERIPLPLGEGLAGDPTSYHREKWRSQLLGDPTAVDYATRAASFDSLTTALDGQATEDDLKWTVYAKRKIVKGVSLTAQVASDHFRPFEIVFARPTIEPTTSKPGEWYYVIRLEFGI